MRVEDGQIHPASILSIHLLDLNQIVLGAWPLHRKERTQNL